jgi:hypothetical protein
VRDSASAVAKRAGAALPVSFASSLSVLWILHASKAHRRPLDSGVARTVFFFLAIGTSCTDVALHQANCVGTKNFFLVIS